MYHITVTDQDWGSGKVSPNTLMNAVSHGVKHGWHIRLAGAHYED